MHLEDGQGHRDALRGQDTYTLQGKQCERCMLKPVRYRPNSKYERQLQIWTDVVQHLDKSTLQIRYPPSSSAATVSIFEAPRDASVALTIREVTSAQCWSQIYEGTWRHIGRQTAIKDKARSIHYQQIACNPGNVKSLLITMILASRPHLSPTPASSTHEICQDICNHFNLPTSSGITDAPPLARGASSRLPSSLRWSEGCLIFNPESLQFAQS